MKWPRVGTVLPIDVDRRNPRQLRVRWDLVDPMIANNRPVEDLDGFTTPFYTDYVDATVSPTAAAAADPSTSPSTAPSPAGDGGPDGSDHAGSGGLELVDDDYFSPPAARGARLVHPVRCAHRVGRRGRCS